MQEYETRISTKGQVVIPKEIRERHGMDVGVCGNYVVVFFASGT